jgi:hypothetical protein
MEVRDQVRQEIVQRAGQALGFAVTTYQPSTAALDFLIQLQYLLLISLGKGRGHRSLRRSVYAIFDLSAISGARWFDAYARSGLDVPFRDGKDSRRWGTFP